MNKYDVIIIGGAPAGLTASLYTARRALSTLIITKDLGGQVSITTEVENYPGTGTITGPELMDKFREQAESAGAKIKYDEVIEVEEGGGDYTVKIKSGEEFGAQAVILAFGLEHRKLNAPGEKELTGRGVAYCATCDGPLFKNKIVGVVGGGNSAFDAADYLSDICEKVYIFNRTEKYRAEQVLIDAVKAKDNIEIMNFTEVKEFKGNDKLEKVILLNNQNGSETELTLSAVFVEIGWMTKTDFVKDLVDLDEYGYVVTDKEAKTSHAGIFAAGDVTNSPFKQAVISAGEGAKAALSAAKYIQEKRGGQFSLAPDLSRYKK